MAKKKLFFLFSPDLENVTIGDGMTEIGWKVFGGCSKLSDVNFGQNVTKIGYEAFQECGFTTLNMPNGLKVISEYSFNDCSKLTSLTIPSSIEEIDVNAFGGADIYSVISLIEEPFSIATHYSYRTYYPFSKNTINNSTLYVPIGTIEKYKETDGWKDFVFIEEGSPSSITNVESEGIYELKRHTLDGKVVKNPQKGINIVQMNNGAIKKVVVK